MLVGVERNILEYLYFLCKQNGSKNTPPLLTNDFLENISVKTTTVLKKGLERLVKKQIINRLKGRRGNGGYIKFNLPDNVYNHLTFKANEKGFFGGQLDKKESMKWTASSSSSSGINNNIIKKEEELSISDINVIENQETIFGFPEEWNKIQTEGIRKKGVKFGESQIKQLYDESKLHPEKEISPEKIQESLDAFLYDLELVEQGKLEKNFYRGKLEYIFGILRKGAVYEGNELYESPLDRSLRENLDRLKARQEKQKKMLDELKSASFEDWYNGVEEDEIKKHIPMYNSGEKYRPFIEKTMKGVFEEEVWPEIKDKFMKEKKT
jgi:hypothetical protein